MFVSADIDLEPVDAVAAILVDEDGRYIMQHRDAYPHIFYPDHWGCFGGAVESGEDTVEALRRELSEELELELPRARVRLFTRFDFDFSPLGKSKVYRIYYDVRINRAEQQAMRLHEGQGVEAFDGAEMLALRRVTPYDAFAIWMHFRAARDARSGPQAPR
jgi:8-oxo-dGTP pyrophosphatase MutT (NUDIX family)